MTTSKVPFWRSFEELQNCFRFCYVFLIGWMLIIKKHFVSFFILLCSYRKKSFSITFSRWIAIDVYIQREKICVIRKHKLRQRKWRRKGLIGSSLKCSGGKGRQNSCLEKVSFKRQDKNVFHDYACKNTHIRVWPQLVKKVINRLKINLIRIALTWNLHR